MKLLLYIVRKDLVRLRWWLVAWLVVLALPILVGVDFVLTGRPALNGVRLPDVVLALLFLQCGTAWLLTIVLVQDDALVGSSQFWLTRPISGPRLLTAKAVGLALILGAIPIVVALPWWLWCGLDARAMTVAALESCAVGVLIGAPAALVAVFCESLARALLWTFVVVAVVLSGGLFFGVAVSQARLASDTNLLISRDIVVAALLLAECALVAALQYFVRRRFVLLAIFVVLAGLAVTFAGRTTWRVFPDEPQLLEPQRADGVNVRLAHAWTGPVSRRPRVGPPESNHNIESLFATDSPPAGTILLGVAARQSWRWPDGGNVQRASLLETHSDESTAFNETLGLKFPGPDPETAAWWKEKRQAFLKEWSDARSRGARTPTLHFPPDSAGWKQDDPSPLVPASIAYGATAMVGAESWVTPSLALKMMLTPADYEARLWLGLLRPRLSFEMPLESGPWHYDAGGRMRITEVVRHVDTAEVKVAGTQAASTWAMMRRYASARGWWDWGYTLSNRVGPVVVNRNRGEFRHVWARGPLASQLVVAGVGVSWERMIVSGGEVMRGGRLVPWPGWIDGASLAVLWLEPEAVFARDVKVPALRVEEISRATAP